MGPEWGAKTTETAAPHWLLFRTEFLLIWIILHGGGFLQKLFLMLLSFKGSISDCLAAAKALQVPEKDLREIMNSLIVPQTVLVRFSVPVTQPCSAATLGEQKLWSFSWSSGVFSWIFQPWCFCVSAAPTFMASAELLRHAGVDPRRSSRDRRTGSDEWTAVLTVSSAAWTTSCSAARVTGRNHLETD